MVSWSIALELRRASRGRYLIRRDAVRELEFWRGFILALMFVAALTLLAASAVHASLLGPIDPFPGAAPPEALLGIVLGTAAVAAFLSWARAWAFAVAATLLALLGTVYGLAVTVPRGEPGDIVYHVSLLAGLIVAAGLLIRRRGFVD